MAVEQPHIRRVIPAHTQYRRVERVLLLKRGHCDHDGQPFNPRVEEGQGRLGRPRKVEAAIQAVGLLRLEEEIGRRLAHLVGVDVAVAVRAVHRAIRIIVLGALDAGQHRTNDGAALCDLHLGGAQRGLRIVEPHNIKIALYDIVAVLEQPAHPKRPLHHHPIKVGRAVRRDAGARRHANRRVRIGIDARRLLAVARSAHQRRARLVVHCDDEPVVDAKPPHAADQIA